MSIRLLSPEDAQKVAAGEVIERPANSIKELLENSIDAHATFIELAVQNGGKTSIRITDNGTGMSHADAHLCFLRHATSKLFSFDDLATIATFGFRGEALASVCGVAKVTLTTKQQGQIEGLQLQIQEGKVISEKVVSCQVGTTILVEDLFYNVPARKKFLKNTATEWNQIIALFRAFCMTYPSVHFVLVHDDNRVYNCPPAASLSDRIAQIFDSKITSAIAPLSGTSEEKVHISGVITTAHYSRYDRSGLHFFVNNRLVKNFQLGRALIKGFNNLLPPGKYPFAAVHLTVDPETVDVNIHPKKEEVLFLHPQKIEHALTRAVAQTLEQQVNQRLTPRFEFFTESPQPTVVNAAIPTLDTANPRHTFDPFYGQLAHPFPDEFSYAPTRTQIETFAQKPASPSVTTQQHQEVFIEKNSSYDEEVRYKIIGQHKTTYILLEHADGLLLVDQHAAHERILYERFAKNFGTTETIELLFPVLVPCAPHEIDLLMPYCELLFKHGIVIEQFGPDQLRVKAVPVYAKQLPLQNLIQEFISWIIENNSHPDHDFFAQLTKKLRAQLACKAAIKAGDVLSYQEMETLLKDLEKTENRFSCPHGRPTQWLLGTHEIEKKFKRIA